MWPIRSHRSSTKTRRNRSAVRLGHRAAARLADRGLRLELLEQRQLLAAGAWATLAASGTGPVNGQAMMLLSEGSILVQGGNNASTTTMYKLSPQANTGSYVNGVWSDVADMNEGRLFFTTAMLPDGRVFAIGGEYPRFSNTAEVYDPVADTWSLVDPAPTPGTRVDLSGAVTGASNASPIVITTNATTAALQNGDTVTIASVAGNTAANGTWTIAALTATTFQLVGSTGNGAFSGSNGTWTGPAKSQFGDDPIEVLPNGQILAGYFNNTTTYRFNPSAAPGTQWTTTAGSKLHGDGSDEEAWVKLPDNSILSYDVFSSQSGTFQAQRYIPATDSWVDASTLGSPAPSILSDPTTAVPGDPTKFLGQGSELGPGFLLPDGRVFYFGANGNTAYYDPATNKWTAGPPEPIRSGTQLAATDDPGAMLPNGHILIALSPLGFIPADSSGNPSNYNFPKPSYIYEFDPTAAPGSEFLDVSPGGGLGGEHAHAQRLRAEHGCAAQRPGAVGRRDGIVPNLHRGPGDRTAERLAPGHREHSESRWRHVQADGLAAERHLRRRQLRR